MIYCRGLTKTTSVNLSPRKRFKKNVLMLSKLLTKPSAFGEPEVEGEGDQPARQDLDDTESEQESVLNSDEAVDDI